ncbi:MAG: hypothetical protein WAV16_02300 [Candidatus Moraniibacteriota bacterium]
MSNSEQVPISKGEGLFDLVTRLQKEIKLLKQENQDLKEKLAKAQRKADYYEVEAEALSAAMD